LGKPGGEIKKFIVDIDEEDADIVVERPASIEDPKVKYPKVTSSFKMLYIIDMTCFIVLYLIYVIYYACRFEKLLRAYVVLL
jgi:hypothetical protein